MHDKKPSYFFGDKLNRVLVTYNGFVVFCKYSLASNVSFQACSIRLYGILFTNFDYNDKLENNEWRQKQNK